MGVQRPGRECHPYGGNSLAVVFVGFLLLKLSSGKSGTEHCCGLHDCPRMASSRTWCRKMLSEDDSADAM